MSWFTEAECLQVHYEIDRMLAAKRKGHACVACGQEHSSVEVERACLERALVALRERLRAFEGPT